MKAEISSCFARAVRHARSALESGDRSPGSPRIRGACPFVAPAPSALALDATRDAEAGTRPSRKRDRLRRASFPFAPVRRVAQDSQRWRLARVMPTYSRRRSSASSPASVAWRIGSVPSSSAGRKTASHSSPLARWYVNSSTPVGVPPASIALRRSSSSRNAEASAVGFDRTNASASSRRVTTAACRSAAGPLSGGRSRRTPSCRSNAVATSSRSGASFDPRLNDRTTAIARRTSGRAKNPSPLTWKPIPAAPNARSIGGSWALVRTSTAISS